MPAHNLRERENARERRKSMLSETYYGWFCAVEGWIPRPGSLTGPPLLFTYKTVWGQSIRCDRRLSAHKGCGVVAIKLTEVTNNGD